VALMLENVEVPRAMKPRRFPPVMLAFGGDGAKSAVAQPMQQALKKSRMIRCPVSEHFEVSRDG